MPFTESLLFLCSISNSFSSSLTWKRSHEFSLCKTVKLLDLLLSTFHSYLLGLIQAVLQIFDGLLHVFLHTLQVGAGIPLHLLLQSKSLISAANLSLQRALQSVRHPLMVSLGLLHLLVLLRHLALHVSFHLIELQLCSKDLTLFMLEGTLSEIVDDGLSLIAFGVRKFKKGSKAHP
uniref:Uncharacterized protein n=1 Tax=Oreochromis niloticus TaxID=8128 RepID=A0A669DUU2_ORENI